MVTRKGSKNFESYLRDLDFKVDVIVLKSVSTKSKNWSISRGGEEV